ncbi:XdhC family protein [Candidatus Uabimicrobium sp. HlEnr_7]|uniref:XdhC family protein n=1 Tax=Candidatus Uabimicrobium helgolandensis TaxID=3095367 RepID=UPI003557E069
MHTELYKNIQKYRNAHLDCVIITIVSARGSTPRKTGAKMAIFPNGKTVGTIGGGCVESQIRQQALDVLLETHESCVATCHLNDKVGVEDGDICGGSLTVFIEYIPGENLH